MTAQLGRGNAGRVCELVTAAVLKHIDIGGKATKNWLVTSWTVCWAWGTKMSKASFRISDQSLHNQEEWARGHRGWKMGICR